MDGWNTLVGDGFVPEGLGHMNTAKVCLFGGALLGAGLSSGAQADIQIIDTLDVLESYHSGYGSDYQKLSLGSGSYNYSYNTGLIEFDTFDFTVLESGLVTFDALSYWSFETFFDTQIKLFSNDGNALTEANYIAGNDDYDYDYLNLGYIDDYNGSSSTLDSFLQVFLDAGDYTIVMGGYYYDIDEVVNGAGESTVYSFDSFRIPDSGEYQLDIIGNVRPTIPTPSGLALLGMTGLAASRRRR